MRRTAKKIILFNLKTYLSETALFPYTNWEQFSSITANPDFSRTTNVSESIHSSLNQNFPRRIKLNNSIEKIWNFKKESVMAYAALQPKRYFNVYNKPSAKRPIRKSDFDRLSSLYEKVICFNNLRFDIQIFDLKEHSIELGSMRRYAYESFNIWLSDS